LKIIFRDWFLAGGQFVQSAAYAIFRMKNFSVIAISDIKEGEEITIVYNPEVLLLPQDMRQSFFEHFVCCCSRCQNPILDELLTQELKEFTSRELVSIAQQYNQCFQLQKEWLFGETTWEYDVQAANEFLETCYLFLTFPLGPTHWRRLRVERWMIQILMTLVKYEKKLERKVKWEKELIEIGIRHWDALTKLGEIYLQPFIWKKNFIKSMIINLSDEVVSQIPDEWKKDLQKLENIYPN